MKELTRSQKQTKRFRQSLLKRFLKFFYDKTIYMEYDKKRHTYRRHHVITRFLFIKINRAWKDPFRYYEKD